MCLRRTVALDLIPQIECSNSYALRLRNPENAGAVHALHTASHQFTADDSRIARCVALINRQSAFQARQVLCRDTCLVGVCPSLLSSSNTSRVTSPRVERGETALPHHRLTLSRQLLLAAHSRTAAFQSPGRPTPGTGHHSGRHSASRFRCSCHSCIHVAIRSYPERLGPYVPDSRPAIVSAAIAAISGGRTKKLPPTHQLSRSLFGTVSAQTHW